MRGKIVISGATLLLVLTAATTLAASLMEDDYEERIEDLERRVARLEVLAGIPPGEEGRSSTDAVDGSDGADGIDGEDGADGQDGADGEDGAGADGEDGEDGTVSSSSGSSSSRSSSSSSSNQGDGSVYSATFSSSGDGTEEFEVDTAGIYTLTVQASGAFSVRVEAANGEEIPDFSVESDWAGTQTVSGELGPGLYELQVDSDAQWVMILTSIGDE